MGSSRTKESKFWRAEPEYTDTLFATEANGRLSIGYLSGLRIDEYLPSIELVPHIDAIWESPAEATRVLGFTNRFGQGIARTTKALEPTNELPIHAKLVVSLW
jgi:hypothetical protein